MTSAFRYAFFMLILGGILYPLVVTGIGQVLFPKQANGSLISTASGKPNVGSVLLSQGFSQPQYFHPRPSQNNYDASNSGGSNYGATNKKLIDRVKVDVATFHRENTSSSNQTVPVDAVTTSASGLDPEISLANAYAQAPRVAQARHLSAETLNNLIESQKTIGFFGEPGVNVLKLNLALDKNQ